LRALSFIHSNRQASCISTREEEGGLEGGPTHEVISRRMQRTKCGTSMSNFWVVKS
jgi:hypothetical protein